MRRVITVLLAGLTLILIACSGASEATPASTPVSAAPVASPSSTSAPAGTAVALASGATTPKTTASEAGVLKRTEAARRAAEVTSAQQTMAYEFTFSIGGIPNVPADLSFGGAGATDMVTGRSHMSLDFSTFFDALRADLAPADAADIDAFLGDGTVEAVSDGATTYIHWPFMSSMFGADTPWISMQAPPGAVPLQGLQGAGLDGAFSYGPDSVLGLLNLLDSFNEVGTEDIRGVSTTHWVGSISFDRLVELIDPTLLDQNQWQYQQLGLLGSSMPLEVWIDGEGLTRRFVMNLDLGVFDPSAAGASFGLRYDFFDFGAPVEVTVPPANEVTDVTKLLTSGFPAQ